jgi:NADH:ubiquinone oxidoreductase subunit E
VSRRLGIEPGKTTPDGQFSLEKVKCVGKCGVAPVLAMDHDYFGEVAVDTLTRILKTYRKPK